MLTVLLLYRLFQCRLRSLAMKRVRLDALLVTRGLFESREKAQRAIMAGEVQVHGRPAPKSGTLVPTDIGIEVSAHERYVGRGGTKLEGALSHFAIDVSGKVCMDIGSSTGGFTDCLLQHGAQRVHAIDVGRGQLHWNLREDPRIVVHEGINVRYLEPTEIGESPEICVADVSFISLTLILPPTFALLTRTGHMIVLIKPQFELGRKQIGKGGIVRDPDAHREAVEKIRVFAEGSLHARWEGIIESPITGATGNKEFFAHFRP